MLVLLWTGVAVILTDADTLALHRLLRRLARVGARPSPRAQGPICEGSGRGEPTAATEYAGSYGTHR